MTPVHAWRATSVACPDVAVLVIGRCPDRARAAAAQAMLVHYSEVEVERADAFGRADLVLCA